MEYVTREKAYELKEKGFDEPCRAYYRQILKSDLYAFWTNKESKFIKEKQYSNSDLKGGIHNFATAPTKEQARIWEEKNK